MKAQDGFNILAMLPKLSYDRQTTLLKLLILSIAAILCKYDLFPVLDDFGLSNLFLFLIYFARWH